MMATADNVMTQMLPTLLADWIDEPVADKPVKALTLDSRQVQEGTLFIACNGLTHHGLDFLTQAIQRGAVAAVCEPGEDWSTTDIRTLAEDVTIPLYLIEGLSSRVSLLASRFYRDPSLDMPVFGVTGTNGKTSCTHFLAQAFSPEQRCGVIGTVGNGLLGALEDASHTTPDAVRLQAMLRDLKNQGADMVAMEVSSHALDQGRAAAVHFDVALLTNLTQDHLDYHQDMAAYADAKRRLFSAPGLNCAVLNMDDAFASEILSRLSPSVKSIGYSLDRTQAVAVDYWLRSTHIATNPDGVTLEIESSWGEGRIKSQLLGRFNVSNLLAVLGVMLYRGVEFDTALEKLSQIRTVTGRMERFGGHDQPLVVVDYAHTPDALEQALKALREHVGGRLVCLFGCGGDRDRGKRPLMGGIAERLADRVIVTDDNPRGEPGDRIVEEILAGMRQPQQAQVVRDRAEAISLSIREAIPGDLILIAGKGHESYQLVGDRVLHFSDREQVLQVLQEVTE